MFIEDIPKWEYGYATYNHNNQGLFDIFIKRKITFIDTHRGNAIELETVAELMSKAGGAGWELVSTQWDKNGSVLWFRRPMVTPATEDA